MANALAINNSDALNQAARLAALPEADLKRDAATAARDRDAETLWAITRAHLILRGRSGASISRHTLASYRTSVFAVIAAFAGTSLLSPHRDSAAVWIRTLEESGKSPGTVTVRLAGARSLYAALRWTGATSADPFQDVKPARDLTPVYDKRRPYSDAEMARLLAIATGQDRVLLLLAGHTALRNFECLSVRWQDVDLEAGTLTVTEGKGRKKGIVTMSRSLVDALTALPRTGDSILTIRSTEGARYRLRVLCQRAGVPYRAVHALRHHAGTKLQAQTGDIHRVARHLRHSSVSTTERYVHLANDALKESVGEW